MKLLNWAGVEYAMCTIAFCMLRRCAAGAIENALLACAEREHEAAGRLPHLIIGNLTPNSQLGKSLCGFGAPLVPTL